MRNVVRIVGLVAALSSGGAGRAHGDDFCVHSKVHLGKDMVESVTMFRGGAVYDFLSTPEEITILDAPRDRFVVLDVTRKVKVVISGDEITKFAEKLRDEARARQVELLVFLANPKFDESYNEATGELSLSAPWMAYKVQTVEPKHPDAARRYADFCDRQAQLSALLRPGSLPPFARLALNEALETRGRLPTEVQLTRYAQQRSARPLSIRAEHRLQWRLLDSDRQRIDEADRHLATFTEVSLADYIRRPVVAAR